MVNIVAGGRVEVSYFSFYVVFGLITYFIWSDLSFFGLLTAEDVRIELSNYTSTTKYSVKLRMLDHFGHYIYLPFCKWINEYLSISEISWITPNVVTAIHFCIAVSCARFYASALLIVRRIGVVLFECRSMLDIMDGVIYRAQAKSKTVLTGWGTWGYTIDGLADTIGALCAMLGVIYRFNKTPPWDPSSLSNLEGKYKAADLEAARKRLTSDDASAEDIEVPGLRRYPRPYINFAILLMAVSVGVRGALWDHFNHTYHNLLGVTRPDIPVAKQFAVLNYSSTWFCLWLWKLHSADALLSYTMLAIFFNNLWRWIRFWAFATVPNLLTVSLICHLHILKISNDLGVATVEQ